MKIKRSEIREFATAAYDKAISTFGSEYAIQVTLPKEFKDPRSSAIKKAVAESGFGCQKGNVIKLFSILLGEDISVDDDAKYQGKSLRGGVFPAASEFSGDYEHIYKGLFVVPLSNDNSHDYAIGEAVMFKGHRDHCLKGWDDCGNHITTDLRLASADEIFELVLKNPMLMVGEVEVDAE